MYHTAIAVYKESGLKQSIPFIIFYLSVYITICIISTNKEDSLSQAILRMMVCKDESKVCLTPSHNFSFLQLTFTTLTMAWSKAIFYFLDFNDMYAFIRQI